MSIFFLVISLMRTFTFLMGHETSLRIILLCLFFISELLFLQYLDLKIPNNGEEGVLISKRVYLNKRTKLIHNYHLIFF